MARFLPLSKGEHYGLRVVPCVPQGSGGALLADRVMGSVAGVPAAFFSTFLQTFIRYGPGHPWRGNLWVSGCPAVPAAHPTFVQFNPPFSS